MTHCTKRKHHTRELVLDRPSRCDELPADDARPSVPVVSVDAACERASCSRLSLRLIQLQKNSPLTMRIIRPMTAPATIDMAMATASLICRASASTGRHASAADAGRRPTPLRRHPPKGIRIREDRVAAVYDAYGRMHLGRSSETIWPSTLRGCSCLASTAGRCNSLRHLHTQQLADGHV